MTGLMISNILLWAGGAGRDRRAVGLARQIGMLYERVAPMGALMTDAGPKIGEASPQIRAARALNGGDGGDRRASAEQLDADVLPVAHLPGVQEAAAGAQVGCAGRSASGSMSCWPATAKRPSIRRSSRGRQLSGFPYVLSTDLGMTYRVSRLPFARAARRARAWCAPRVSINNREQLESLFNAKEMGVGFDPGLPRDAGRQRS